MFEVYRLVSPSGRSYIGVTGVGFRKRFANHLSGWKRNRRHCLKLCRAFDKYPPQLWQHETLISTDSKEEAEKREIELINKFNSIKKGYNILPGGSLSRSGIPCSETHKQNLSAALMGRKFSDEHKRNLSKTNWMRGKSLSSEMRQQLSIAGMGNQNSLGCKQSTEQKQNRSQRYSGSGNPNFGKSHSEETRRKIALSKIGKRASLETRAKLSAARTGPENHRFGKHWSPETRQKIIMTLHSDSVRARISQTKKEYWRQYKERQSACL